MNSLVDMSRHSRLGSAWTKSTRSGYSGNCVEIRRARGNAIEIRESKNPDGPTLLVSEQVWLAFIADIKSGHLDQAH